MDIQTFINNYYEAFSLKAELPIAFWYSDSLLGELKQTQGCLFKALPAIRQQIKESGESTCDGGSLNVIEPQYTAKVEGDHDKYTVVGSTFE